MCKSKTTIIFLTALFSLINSLYAQSEKERLDFFHSGIVKTEGATVRVPIEIWDDLILLKVKVNGNNATFMWDNGFSVSGIDSSLVQDYKLLTCNDGNEITAIDGNNVEVNAELLKCPEFEIKGIMIFDTPFVKLDFRNATMTKELKIEGAIGSSIINKLNWKFNFDENYVEISEKPFIVTDNDLVLPFKIIESRNTHAMPISFNDIETECLVDFGYNSNVIEINTTNAKFFYKADATKTFGARSISLSGIAPLDTIYTIKDNFSWELSGNKLNVKPKICFTKATGNVTIGNKIFRDTYNVIINTSDDMVYALSPRKKPITEINDKAHGYKILNVDSMFKIMSIDLNASTVNGDVELLDEVISINGKVTADFEDNHSLIIYQKELLDKQEEIVFKFKDGREISLTPQSGIEYKFKNEKELW